jgi:hypothetical protein
MGQVHFVVFDDPTGIGIHDFRPAHTADFHLLSSKCPITGDKGVRATGDKGVRATQGDKGVRRQEKKREKKRGRKGDRFILAIAN